MSHAPPDSLVAFIADGEDSFVAVMIGDRWFPAVTMRQNVKTLAHMERAMQNLANGTGRTIRRYEFSARREVGVIEPEAKQ